MKREYLPIVAHGYRIGKETLVWMRGYCARGFC